jgi:hypothetical protein
LTSWVKLSFKPLDTIFCATLSPHFCHSLWAHVNLLKTTKQKQQRQQEQQQQQQRQQLVFRNKNYAGGKWALISVFLFGVIQTNSGLKGYRKKAKR